MKDCSTCPSRLVGDDAVRVFFGREIGGEVNACAMYGHVLGRPGLDPSAVQKIEVSFGKDCHMHGETPDTKPAYPEMRVTAPLTQVFAETNKDGSWLPKNPPTAEEQAEVYSCNACEWFIPANIVQEELGWYLPLCAATGRLLFPKRLTKEPKNCGQARLGENLDTTEGLALIPQYDDAWKLGSPVKAGTIVYKQHEFVEPTEYPTDKPVSAHDTADGIRSWRRIMDPEGSGNYVDLPIFELSFFDDSEQAKVPRSGDDEHPEWYVDHAGLVYDLAVEMLELDETPVLIGAAGTGKTELFRHLAWMLVLPFDRISITRSSEVDDLAGKYLFENGATVWTNGRVAKCWSSPGVLCLDEPNVGPDEVWQFIRPMTDNSKQLVLDQARGQRVERHNWRFFGLAMNQPWDIKNIGANEISDADGNRLAAISVGLPPAEVERDILVQRCLGDGYEVPIQTLDTIMAIASDLRVMVENETLPISWGIRPQIAVARKTKWYGLEKAYKRAVCDRLDPASSENVLRVVRGYVK